MLAFRGTSFGIILPLPLLTIADPVFTPFLKYNRLLCLKQRRKEGPLPWCYTLLLFLLTLWVI